MTFAQFMQACLYSPRGGFYSSRGNRISTHFGTSPTSHPVFGALIARQLEQMWHLLGDPPVFHVIEVGSGDGVLAQSIVHACWRMALGWLRCFTTSLKTTSLAGSNHLTTPLTGTTGLEMGCPQAGETRSWESNELKPKDFGRSEMLLAVSCVTS